MRTRWARVTAFLIASSTGGLAAGGCTTTMRISRAELQADIAKRFPREYDKVLVHIRATDPQIDFPGTPDMMGVRMNVQASTMSGHHQITGTARVEGQLQYVEAEHAFFLRDARVTELVIDQQLLEVPVRRGVEEILSNHPIYRLDAKRSKREAKAINHLRDAHIDPQRRDLVLTVGL